jgi:hypothetical protein
MSEWIRNITDVYMYTYLICFSYQPDDDPHGFETYSWVNQYFTKLCFDDPSVLLLIYIPTQRDA